MIVNNVVGIGKLVFIVASLAIALVLVGCSFKSEKSPEENVSNLLGDDKCSGVGEENAPLWVCRLKVEEVEKALGMITETGSSPKIDGWEKGDQIDEALANARARLSSALTTEVAAGFESRAKRTGKKADGKSVENSKATITQASLIGSKQVRRWENRETGAITVLVGVPQKMFNELVDEAFEEATQ